VILKKEKSMQERMMIKCWRIWNKKAFKLMMNGKLKTKKMIQRKKKRRTRRRRRRIEMSLKKTLSMCPIMKFCMTRMETSSEKRMLQKD